MNIIFITSRYKLYFQRIGESVQNIAMLRKAIRNIPQTAFKPDLQKNVMGSSVGHDPSLHQVCCNLV